MKTVKKGTELVSANSFVKIAEPMELAKFMLEENTNLPVSCETFSFDHLEEEIGKNPLIVDKIIRKLQTAIQDSDVDELVEQSAKLREYKRKRCIIIEVGQAMYTYDESKKPAEMTRFLKFIDTTNSEVRIMRQVMALNSFDELNRLSFGVAKQDKDNVLGLTKESLFDKNTLYSDSIIVDILFLGAKKSKKGTKFHAIEIKRSQL